MARWSGRGAASGNFAWKIPSKCAIGSRRARLVELLDRDQVLVLPSRTEGQPMAVLEAMARGLCIIASDVGGLSEMIGGGCGVIVPPDDVESIAAALRLIVYDDELRARYGAAAYTQVENSVRHPRRGAPARRDLPRGVQMRVCPIRVLFVVPTLSVGGAERHVTTMLPRMDTARFTPSVICIGEEGALFPTLPAAGIEAAALRLHKRQAVRSLIQLVMMMRRTRPDVVVVQALQRRNPGPGSPPALPASSTRSTGYTTPAVSCSAERCTAQSTVR